MPGSGGLSYFAFSVSPLSANDAGALGFSSIPSNGSQGVFVGSSGDSAQMVARTGDLAPDTGGASHLLLTDNPSINSAATPRSARS